MAFKDILISLNTHPDPTPDAVVDFATRFASGLDARLSAVIWELRLHRPGTFHVADALLDLPKLLQTEMKKSADHAGRLVGVFEKAARGANLFGRCEVVRCAPVEAPDRLAAQARLHDVTIVPVLPNDDVGTLHAETAIFGSGRPVLVVPQLSFAGAAAASRVALAWDFSAPAARALADAMPLLARAGEVQAVTVTNEKPLKDGTASAELPAYLDAHGIKAQTVTVDAAGRPIGEVLQDYVRSNDVDLLVMGAYGHSRLQQFILGGATRTILQAPPAPVLLSH